MATRATTWRSERARIAGMSSRPNRPPDDPELVEARRNLRALLLEEHVRKVLEGAPPLNDDQRNRIAALLRASGRSTIEQSNVRPQEGDAVDDDGPSDLDERGVTGPQTAEAKVVQSS